MVTRIMQDVSDEASSKIVVFVVEDNELIQELVATALEEAGFAIALAGSGDEALTMLGDGNFSPIKAVVTDIELGSKISGWDVAKRARELHPEIPVIYMTGARAGDWSANGVPNSILVTKPFANAQIVTAVSQLLNAPMSAPST